MLKKHFLLRGCRQDNLYCKFLAFVSYVITRLEQSRKDTSVSLVKSSY